MHNSLRLGEKGLYLIDRIPFIHQLISESYLAASAAGAATAVESVAVVSATGAATAVLSATEDSSVFAEPHAVNATTATARMNLYMVYSP